MGSTYIAFMKIIDKNGKEFLYALHENKNAEEEFSQLTEEEQRLFLAEALQWN
jgi:hypothetical protein